MRIKNDWTEERDRDLIRAYRRIIEKYRVNSRREALRRAVESPSVRFWTTPECAARALRRIMRGDDLAEMKPHRREMFFELYRRYRRYRKKPGFSSRSVVYICTVLVQEPAPKFYMRAGTAHKIFGYRMRIKKGLCER